MSTPATTRCRRVGHSIIKAGGDLGTLAERLDGAAWDMVELDVLARGDELIVAHSPDELDHPTPVRFADALTVLRDALPPSVELDVDLKATGYEHAVLETLRSLGLVERTLVSSMEEPSLRVLRAAAPELRLGLSVPKARRNYLSHPLTRPAAYAMLAYLRRVMPARAAQVVSGGLADAIMAHWGVVTPALVRAVSDAGGELYVWTVDDAHRLLSLHALGVSAVITNDRELFERAGLAPT
ncbi:MAG TPA: glycerophosphodiester phosphodiesterase [Solirubrobacteraceae bacterium]|nr:glycerophosphodiester phosphodiesterase [Solirubrobacteraceae bacterium]